MHSRETKLQKMQTAMALDLLLQAVANVAEQQVSEAFEAGKRDKVAAVSKSLQTVQRRASKEALHQVCAQLILLQSCVASRGLVLQGIWLSDHHKQAAGDSRAVNRPSTLFCRVCLHEDHII